MSDLNDMEGALSQAADPWGVNNSVGNYTAPPAGPLSRTAPDIQALLAQFVPQNDSRDRYLALAAGFGSATKTGRFGESLGNVASALQDQKMQQEKLRTQYVPLIMQHVAMQDAQAEKAMKLQTMQQDLKLKELAEKRAQGLWVYQEKALKDASNEGQGTAQTIPGQMATPQLGGVNMFSQGTQLTSPPQTMSGAPQPSSNMLRNLNLQSLAGLPNVADRLKIYQHAQEGITRKPGEVYQMPDGTTQVGPPAMDKNMQLVPDGRGGYSVRPATGAEQAVRDLTTADADAKGDYEMVTVPNGAGPSLTMTKSQFKRMSASGPLGNSPQGEQLPVNQGNAQVSPDILRMIAQDAARNGGPPPTVNLNSPPGTRLELTPDQQRAPIPYRPSGSAPDISRFGQGLSNAEQDTNKLALNAGDDINKSWIKTSQEPIQQAGQVAQGTIDSTIVARASLKNMGSTGWGTETKAAAANILTGLGVAPKNVESFATNAQVFQGKAMERLWITLNAAKGPQTEGDAARASQTWAQLRNTSQANEFILDMSQATAERDKAKAAFYNNALPVAQKNGDLPEIDREWSKRVPSIFDMPIMQRWKKK